MKTLLFYELAADGLSRVQEHFEAHRARLKAYHDAGSLLMAGPYGDPPVGALAIFTSRESAESFVTGDPFVLNGIVARHVVHDWAEGVAG